MTLIDISRPLTGETAVWPQSQAFTHTTVLSLQNGNSVNFSNLLLNSHTGTHIDAPYHYTDTGQTIEQLDLRPFWGTAQLVTIHKTAGSLTPADFAAYDLSLAPRLLVHSPLSNLPLNQFPSDCHYPSPELADFLAQHGIILYGSDAPSMDALDSKTLPGHHALHRHHIAILEGLALADVPDGLYELSALPLKIVGGDGSPVRAVLKK
ncbi:MAG: cyclase family protein [Anaerolineae bacterium]|nr:cyclase family protein [Anaerolineae bacterium]